MQLPRSEFKLSHKIYANMLLRVITFLVALRYIRAAFDMYSPVAMDCKRPWPNMDLFLPVRAFPDFWRNFEWRNTFLRSVFLFWPLKVAHVGLVVILNEECRGLELVDDVERILNETTNGLAMTSLRYSPVSRYYRRKGHNRQQLLMFHGDEYSNAEYIAFVDTDCFFETYVDREDLFEDGKPVINGRVGPPQSDWWIVVPQSTFAFLRELEPMRCMNFFPFIVRRIHLYELRKHVESIVRTALSL